MGTEIYVILFIFMPCLDYAPSSNSPLNMQLEGKFQVVKIHLYKYWMMPGKEAVAGTAIDFISLFS